MTDLPPDRDDSVIPPLPMADTEGWDVLPPGTVAELDGTTILAASATEAGRGRHCVSAEVRIARAGGGRPCAITTDRRARCDGLLSVSVPR